MKDQLIKLEAIVSSISSITGRLEKERIISENKDNKYFIEMCKFLYDPMIVTGISIKKIEKLGKSDYTFDFFGIKESKTFLEVLDYLKEHNTGRDVDIEVVQDYISEHKEYSEILKKIFTKDLKLGIDATTLNKVMGDGFIKTFDVMLAENYFENVDFVSGKRFQIDTKLDGNRILAFVEQSGVSLYTRQGQSYKGMIDIEEEFKKLPVGYVYDGELIADIETEDTEELFRATTSAVRKDGTKTGVIAHIFDMIPIENFWLGYCPTPSEKRREVLHEIFTMNNFRWLKEVEILYTGDDVSKINYWLEEITSKGGEGVMVHLCSGPYECKRSKQLLKVKKFKTADVRVLDINSGTGRFENTLGSITVEFEYKGNKYTCDVGSGFTDEQRSEYWNNKDLLLNKIVEIKYFEISQDANGKYSMRFPTWIDRIRDEKDEISMY